MEKKVISIPIHNIFGAYCLYEQDGKELYSIIRPHLLQKNITIRLNFTAVRLITSTFIDSLFIELYNFAPIKKPLSYINMIRLGPCSEIINNIYNITYDNFIFFHHFPIERKKLEKYYKKYDTNSDKKLLEELFKNLQMPIVSIIEKSNKTLINNKNKEIMKMGENNG